MIEQYLAQWHLEHLSSSEPPSPAFLAHCPLSQIAVSSFASASSCDITASATSTCSSNRIQAFRT